GLANLSIADRATIGNMSPEYGATCGFFPVDDDTLRYLADTARPPAHLALVAAYTKAQGMYRTKSTPDPIFTDVLKLELSQVEPSLAGPKRPQDRVALKAVTKGLTVKPWVKTSLAPGSQVVADYLDKSGLQKDLDKLGYNLVGFGCTTCIGNSGPLAPEISKAINEKDLVAAAVLS